MFPPSCCGELFVRGSKIRLSVIAANFLEKLLGGKLTKRIWQALARPIQAACQRTT